MPISGAHARTTADNSTQKHSDIMLDECEVQDADEASLLAGPETQNGKDQEPLESQCAQLFRLSAARLTYFGTLTPATEWR